MASIRLYLRYAIQLTYQGVAAAAQWTRQMSVYVIYFNKPDLVLSLNKFSNKKEDSLRRTTTVRGRCALLLRVEFVGTTKTTPLATVSHARILQK